VQVDPIKPRLKAPGYGRLKLKYDNLLSSFAFKFNLRRYNVEMCVDASCDLSNCKITLDYQWCDIRSGGAG